ncbi:hypothetical protein [Paenibacillus hunanensis]|uniref:Uncharacterized protein n=1 Tax=Paenibacillus hunanensis TaxID=539262 RepID=A0ABU1IWS1_9BACL|nr:hypothetical protein [Paenibacillus hunanensis]MDR6243455.1 hypothetical protein [Paenibacillus hunanensis]GGI97845.1 hypothetical protein GCM10008022_03180 [Paenibacillus hunanensis]
MKHKLVALMVVCLLLSLPISVFAQGMANQQNQATQNQSNSGTSHSGSKGSIDGAKEGSKGIIGKQIDAYYEDPDNQPGLFERSISDVLIGTANFLIRSFGMKDVTLLVFDKNPNPTSDGFLQGGDTQASGTLYLGVFTEGMMSAIDALYATFEHFMPYPVVIIVMVLAFLSLWNSTQAEKRSQWKDYVTAFLVGILSIRFGSYLWNFVSATTEYFTDMIWDTMVRHGVQPDLFLNMIWGTGAEGYNEMIQYRGFVVSILVLAAAIMTAMINYQYTMRVIMLMILVAVFVPSCIITIFPKYRHSLQIWWDLFISYMLMPCGHALALGLFFLLLKFSPDGISNWVIVAYLFGFSAIHGIISKIVGGEEQQRSGMGSMFGVGSMMALGRMFSPKGSSWGRKGKQSGREAEQTSQAGSESMAAGTGNMAAGGASDAAIASSGSRSAAPISWKRKAVQTGGRVAGLALNYGAKTAGTVAGTSIGLMAGNPVIGAAVGMKLGGMAGKGVEYMARGGIAAGKGAAQGVQAIQQRRQASKATKEFEQESNSGMNAGSVSGSGGSEIAPGSIPLTGSASVGATQSEAGLSVAAAQVSLPGRRNQMEQARGTGTITTGQSGSAQPTTSAPASNRKGTSAPTNAESTIPSFLKQRQSSSGAASAPSKPVRSTQQAPTSTTQAYNAPQGSEQVRQSINKGTTPQQPSRPVKRYSESSRYNEPPLPEPPPEESQEPVRKRHPSHYNYDI